MQEKRESGATPDAEPAVRQPSQREDGRRDGQRRLYVEIAILVLIVGYGVAFVLENHRRVEVHFIVGSAGVSLIWVILLSVALGLLLGLLLPQLRRRRRRRH